MMANEIIRRAPAIDVQIRDLKENMGRVSITGTVVNKNSEINSFVLDDGQKQILVLANRPEDFDRVKEGQFVRVLGKVWGQQNELEIQAEIIQDFSNIDKELFRKVFYS